MAQEPRIVASGRLGWTIIMIFTPGNAAAGFPGNDRAWRRKCAYRLLSMTGTRTKIPGALSGREGRGGRRSISLLFGSWPWAQNHQAGLLYRPGGTVTFQNAKKTVEVAQKNPARVSFTGDGLSLFGAGAYRGKRNEPAFVAAVAKHIADIGNVGGGNSGSDHGQRQEAVFDMNNEPPEKLQIRSLLKEKEFHFKKKWGQNFIFDLNLLRRIVEVAGIQAGDRVVEIGPGAGTLTRMLLEKGAEVLAVEIDAALLPVLAQVLDGTRGIVVQGDALKVNFDEMTANHNMAPPYKVVANLPYYITTPLIMSLLENHDQIADIVVMVQKEVAERLTASPGTKEYGAVTLAVEYYAEAEILFNIPRRLFIPVPEVDSALLRLKPRAERRRDILPGEELQTRERLFKLIKAAFGQRRKTLLNALSSLVKGLNKEKIVAMLEKGGIDPQTRGETLSLTQYEQLAVIWAEMDKQEKKRQEE